MSDITLEGKSEKQITEILTSTIYQILNPLEFVLLEQTTKKNQTGPCYFFRYGELIRKFRLIENKRFIEITVCPHNQNVIIELGIGSRRFTLQQLRNIGMLVESATNSENITDLLKNSLHSLVNHANGFFKNDPLFWQQLESPM